MDYIVHLETYKDDMEYVIRRLKLQVMQLFFVQIIVIYTRSILYVEILESQCKEECEQKSRFKFFWVGRAFVWQHDKAGNQTAPWRLSTGFRIVWLWLSTLSPVWKDDSTRWLDLGGECSVNFNISFVCVLLCHLQKWCQIQCLRLEVSCYFTCKTLWMYRESYDKKN